MQLFKQSNNLLITLKEKPFQLEKDMQKLFEANLEAMRELKRYEGDINSKIGMYE